MGSRGNRKTPNQSTSTPSLSFQGDFEYFIKWKGFPSAENTWEPKEHLGGCQDIIGEYHEGLKKKELVEVAHSLYIALL